MLFAGPADELIADVMTDAQGHASAHMAAGYVTVIRPSNSIGFDLTTVLGVKQGDTIEFGVYPGDFTSLGGATIQLPMLSNNQTAQVFTPCGFLSTLQPVYADPACSQHIGILGRSSGTAPLYTYLTNQTLTAGGTIQMQAWQAMVLTQVTLTGLVGSHKISPVISPFTDIGLRYQEGDKDFATGSGHGPVQNYWRPPFNADLLYRTRITRSDDSALGDQEVFARTPAAAAVSFAMSDLEARWLYPPAVDLTGPSPTFIWPQQGQDTATVGWFSTRYTGRAGAVRWDIVGSFLNAGGPGPGLTGGVFVLPQLPDPGLRVSIFSNIDVARIRLLAVNPRSPTISCAPRSRGCWTSRPRG